MNDEKDPVWDETLSAEEFAKRESAALRALEGPVAAEMREHIEWFCRRYRTPLDRMRYVRRQMASIAATQEKIERAR
jgi:hypothetical protein